MRAGWPQGQTHVEHFVPLPTEHDGPRYAIVLARSRISGEVPAGGSALAALRALGVEVDASCEGGICGACRVRWLEGPPIHRDRVLSPARTRAGRHGLRLGLRRPRGSSSTCEPFGAGLIDNHNEARFGSRFCREASQLRDDPVAHKPELCCKAQRQRRQRDLSQLADPSVATMAAGDRLSRIVKENLARA